MRVRTSEKICVAAKQTEMKEDHKEKSDKNRKNEMDYCIMMNKFLPEQIKVIGWSEVTPDFNARFSATSRTYRYFFLRKRLNIVKMRQAATHLLGKHDFRNFCKMDIANVSNFVREIYDVDITRANSMANSSTEDEVWMLEITGVAFLWHMVRCIMAVLFLVGEDEEPEVVLKLLDVETCSSKPSYSLAADDPLVLHRCNFENLNLRTSAQSLWLLTAHYRQLWERSIIAAAHAKNSLDFLCDIKLTEEESIDYIQRLSSKRKNANLSENLNVDSFTTFIRSENKSGNHSEYFCRWDQFLKWASGQMLLEPSSNKQVCNTYTPLLKVYLLS